MRHDDGHVRITFTYDERGYRIETAYFDEHGISHGDIRDLGGLGIYVMAVRDPDNIHIKRLADRFHGLLTPQDEHVPRLHVTIQNKVAPSVAKGLQQHLAASFEPHDFAFAGIALHRYRGGPWEFVKRWPFRG